MAKGWYILSTYLGSESKVERTIRSYIDSGALSSYVVLGVKVPLEVREYVFVELDLPDLNWKDTCTKIRRIQGVTGFVGTNSNERPRPISADEAKALLQKAGEIKGEKPTRMKQTFSVGEKVKIIEGAFASFTGTIEEVNLEKNKLRVMVEIFGRATPVELDLLQVEKI